VNPSALWAPRAWVGGQWQSDVLLTIGGDGRWADVRPQTPRDTLPARTECLAGPLLPGLVNAHSHAFQRAFAGHAERRESATQDSFWTWRDRMYAVALTLTPEALHGIALDLYRELLAGGYTQVCEFHYLHHRADGTRHAPDPWAMARALADAAVQAGIGLTLLPVLYERAGFAHDSLRDDQRRFATTPEDVIAARDAVRRWALPDVDAGVAIHSLRAASPASIRRLLGLVGDDPAPIHIHVAEQTAEVDDCLAHTGQRPVAWLLGHAGIALDRRWQLVHATHTLPSEVSGIAACGAGVVICPTTEANLGDGIPDLPGLLAAGVPLSIGSDSQVGRQWPEELRWLEYAQRLTRRERNVAADPPRQASTAARLFEACLQGGAAAAGFKRSGLQPGARADALMLSPPRGPAGPADPLDALVFAADSGFAQRWVAGRRAPAIGVTHSAS